MPSTENPWSPGRGEILTVSALLEMVGAVLDRSFKDVWVEGEISDLRVPSSGHSYFTVADDRCRMKAVCFKGVGRLLETPLKDGESMLFRGYLAVYGQRGDLQFVVEHAEPAGAGLMRLMLEATRRKLAAEGLFDPERKRKPPRMPKGIAVVTSPTGAAVRDVINVLTRRAPWVNVYICPAVVQGAAAPASIIEALALADSWKGADTVILGRGGGSSDDLSAFNDEAVVRAVAALGKPVISAVGHETDITLSDFAADLRAPTPSAAAELAVAESSHLADHLRHWSKSLDGTMENLLLTLRGRLAGAGLERFEPGRRVELKRIAVDRLLMAADTAAERVFSRSKEKFSAKCTRLNAFDPLKALETSRTGLDILTNSLDSAAERRIGNLRHRLAVAGANLKGLSPMAVLGRGYAIVRGPDGGVIRKSTDAKLGGQLSIMLAKGSLGAEVNEIIEEGKP